MTDPRPTPGAGAPPRMPRWVKIAVMVVGLLLLLVLVLRLTGIAGEHGPGMHASTGQLPLRAVTLE